MKGSFQQRIENTLGRQDYLSVARSVKHQNFPAEWKLPNF